MTTVGIALLLVGAVLLVAEAHLPTAGVFGVAGVAGVVAGIALLFGEAGLAAALAVPVAIAAGAAALGFLALATLKGTRARRGRVHGGSEGLVGQVGVVRLPLAPVGQVFVHGALWRARRALDPEWDGPLGEGDAVVVERVEGLTLAVRKAEEWELTP
jgi:membrane-bound ClpP family serine protease